MSYLGRKPIKIPSQVNLVLEGNVLLVEGPLGSLKRKIDNEINVQIDNDTLVVKKPLKKKHFSLWGLYRKLIVNMVTGVSIGFSTQLKMVGVGYRAEVIQSDNGTLSLLLKLGFSHPIQMDVPAGIEVSIVKTSNNDIIVFSGIDNEAITSFASKVRDLRRPEPYKGKGLSYLNENIRRKEGKKK